MTRIESIVREEAFGAALLDGVTGRWSLVPTPLADIVLGAARSGTSFFDAYFARAGDSPYTESEVASHALFLSRAHILDDDMRVSARVVDDARSGHALSAPLLTHIQLTRACNMRCTHCFVDVMAKPDPRELTTEQMLALFADLSRAGAPVVVLGGGEPMLRKDFWTLVDGVSQHGLFASLCTNGTLVDDAAAARIAASAIREVSISVDGPDEESHARMRGPGRFEQALTAIARLVDAGVPDVQMRVTVTSTNVHRLLDFADAAARSRCHRIAFKPFRRTETGAAFDHADLDVDRLTYLRAIERAQAAWPAGAPAAIFDDGVPERTPDWAHIMPAFGCVGGTTSLSVMYDGRVTGCGFVLDDDDWSLHDHDVLSAWRRAPTLHTWRSLTGNTTCTTECDNFSSCGGGCRARATGAGRTMQDRDPWADCVLDDHEKPKNRTRLRVLA